MKFVCPDIWYVFDTEIEGLNTLIIENQKLFYEIVTDIQLQIEGREGRAVLSDNDRILEIHKNIEMISRFIPFDMNQKKLLSKIESGMVKLAVCADYYEESMKLLGEIESLLLKISFNLMGNVDFTRLTVSSLVKAAGVSLSNDYFSLAEKLIDYFELVREYDHSKLFILVNLRSYISDEEAFQFMEAICNRKFHVIMIENYEYPRWTHEERYIVDQDLCEIK